MVILLNNVKCTHRLYINIASKTVSVNHERECCHSQLLLLNHTSHWQLKDDVEVDGPYGAPMIEYEL